MKLRGGYLAVALKLQEAADSGDSLSARDIQSRLSDCINDCYRGTGNWAYYIDHFGDGESGDVIYSCNGDTFRAPYEISGGEGAAKCTIDTASAKDVVPRTVYEEEQDEADHYAAMEESLRTEKLYTELPLYERFISKSEREKATADDFAGKGKSFPILKPEDIMPAVHSMGRAGAGNLGPSGIKSRIIAIAKRKGWEKHLPKGWQPTETTSGKEARTEPQSTEGQAGRLALKESSAFAIDLTLNEAFGDAKKIKLISVGKGSTAFYTAEALKQAAVDRIFAAGTPMRIDHPTPAEEAARPEGSVKDWGAVLATDAAWMESYVSPKTGKDLGPGLYSEVKPFSDHAALINEKAPYAGVSICARGEALREGGKVVTREGVPVLAKFTSADGVDMVTRAGAGGLFVSEAAKPANSHQEDSDMDAAEFKKLQESVTAQAASNARLLERAIKGDAREMATKILKGITLAEAAKERVIEAVTRDFASLPVTDGALDTAKFTEAVNAAAKTEGAYVASLIGSGQVRGMGAAPVVQIDAKEAERKAAENKQFREAAVQNYMALGLPKDAAEAAAGKEAA